MSTGYIDEGLFSRMCSLLGTSVEDIRSKSRKRELVYRRVILGVYMYEEMGMTLESVTRVLNRDRECIYHYRMIYNNEIGMNKMLRGFDKAFKEGLAGI